MFRIYDHIGLPFQFVEMGKVCEYWPIIKAGFALALDAEFFQHFSALDPRNLHIMYAVIRIGKLKTKISID